MRSETCPQEHTLPHSFNAQPAFLISSVDNMPPNCTASSSCVIGTCSSLANALGSPKFHADPDDASVEHSVANSSFTAPNDFDNRNRGSCFTLKPSTLSQHTLQINMREAVQRDMVTNTRGNASSMNFIHQITEPFSLDLSAQRNAIAADNGHHQKLMTPGSANKKTLAKDILNALGASVHEQTTKATVVEEPESSAENATSILTLSDIFQETSTPVSREVIHIRKEDSIKSSGDIEATMRDTTIGTTNLPSSPAEAFIEEVPLGSYANLLKSSIHE